MVFVVNLARTVLSLDPIGRPHVPIYKRRGATQILCKILVDSRDFHSANVWAVSFSQRLNQHAPGRPAVARADGKSWIFFQAKSRPTSSNVGGEKFDRRPGRIVFNTIEPLHIK